MNYDKSEFELTQINNNLSHRKTEYFLEENDLELCQAFKNIEKEMRLGFIRKVYGILIAQLAVTTIMCTFSMTSQSWAEFQQNNLWLMWFSLIITLTSMIVLVCVPGFVRKVPANYIVTGVFTICEGYLVSLICATTDPSVVFMAAFMTCAMTCALSVYACKTKTDFTVYNSLLFLALSCLFLLGLFTLFTQNSFLNVLYCSLGVFIYSIYLIIDTQMIIESGKYAYETDDYLLAAINLYLDIINLFIYILRIFKK